MVLCNGGHRLYPVFYYLVDDECDVHVCRIDLLMCIDLDPYARSLRQNFYFEEQFEVEFDGDPMHGKSRIFDSLDLECSGPNPSSSDNRDEVLLEQLAWKSLNGSLSNRKSSADAMLDLLTGFEDEYEGDTYRYDDEGELWAVDMDFI